MKKLSVATMRCEKCVARISGALEEAGIAFEISLADKMVSVDEAKVGVIRKRLISPCRKNEKK